MNILIEIGHPAHVHFFKEVIGILQSKGHSILIVTRNKEITNHLLDRLGYSYIHLTDPASSKLGLIFELLSRWYKIFKIIKERNIDVSASISGISTALPSWICGIKSVTFTDTDDAVFTNRIAFSFSTLIATPSFYIKNLGKSHCRYFGLQELAYLRNFHPETGEIHENVSQLPEKFCVLRLIAYDALHDRKIARLDNNNLDRLINNLEKFGEVVIISQRELPTKYSKYIFNFSKEKIHHLLGGCQLFVGESPTMAVEFSMLGIPSFLLSDRYKRLGYVLRLGADYNLLENYDDFEKLIIRIKNINNIETLKKKWKERAEKFKTQVDDVAQVAANIIENIGS